MFILMLVAIYGIIGELSNPGRDPAGRRRRDCADPRALHVGDPAGQRRRAGVDRAGGGVVHRRHLCADARRADGRRHRVVFPRRADAVQPRRARRSGCRWRYIIPATLVTAAFFIFVVGRGLARAVPAGAGRPRNDAGQDRARARRALTRPAARCSSKANTGTPSAKCRSKQDQPVEIVGVEGLTLKVKPKTQ